MSLLFFILSGIVVAEGVRESPYMVIPEPAVIEVIKGECVKPCLISAVKDTALGKEGYQLSILPQGVKMSYGDQAGRFYGLQTLNQIEAQYTGKFIPCGKIID
ncbi:MAG: glycoside hydrolase family 20 zincin-like fold domain-containing protein, partial [Akkermansia sp.]